MALDGVKILDGDLAHDAYAAVLAAVQAGQPATAIRKAFPLLPRKTFDDLDNELYLTSTALAYWESGLLSASDVADLETKVWSLFNEKDWVGLFGASEGKKRKTQLQALFKKLGKPHAVAEPKPIEGIFREDQAYAFRSAVDCSAPFSAWESGTSEARSPVTRSSSSITKVPCPVWTI